MITLNSCPKCNSHAIAKYRQGIQTPDIVHEIMPGVKVNAAIITRYWVCQNCNLIFQNPRLRDVEIKKYYSTGYYRRTLDATVEQTDRGELIRAKTDAGIIKEHIGKVKSHLDVGGGRGYLLDTVGADLKICVETDINYVKVKDITVYSDLDQVPKKSFDLVTCIHVLEHVSKPLDYLKKMAKFVKKEGYLVIEVPTWKSPGGPLRLAHLYHFEPDVLKLMCKRVGLEVIDVEFTPHLLLICKVNNNSSG